MDKHRIFQLRSMPYDEYLKTPEWAERRNEAIERDGGRCRACNADKELQVHHRTYERRGNEDLDDLTTLCNGCHEHFHERMHQIDIMNRTYSDPFDEISEEERFQRNVLKWENAFVGWLATYPHVLSHVRGIVSEDEIQNEGPRTIFCLLMAEQPLPPSFRPSIPATLSEIDGRKLPTDEQKQTETAMGLCTRIKRYALLLRSKELKTLMQDAIEAKDSPLLRQYQQEFLAIHRQLRTINTAVRLQNR